MFRKSRQKLAQAEQLRRRNEAYLQQLASEYAKTRRTDDQAVEVFEQLAENPQCETRWLQNLAMIYVVRQMWGRLKILAEKVEQRTKNKSSSARLAAARRSMSSCETLRRAVTYAMTNNLGEWMKIAIIGAGFGGMAAAYDLKKAGHEVTIYESANYVGGLASGFKEPHWDWSVEKFYHHWFQSDSEMLGLIKELGWEDKVLFPRPLTVMYHKGKFYPFDSILKMALFPGLGFGLDKIRFGFVGFFLRLTNNWKALEKVTADAWMMKWAGKNVYEKMWKPLLVGKFGPYYRDVNMAWMWARIKARTTRLGTFEGGFQRFRQSVRRTLARDGR